ncbi:MAG TPA: 23S rRNA (guanosine(2251)-2'-O)-methyltransferase RlmB [Actinomycetota bacterium]|nr:23S rRNA (guanosine(2251)-2'-O)-methyltransferase RlmB [Actinomycetota bacterium]
MLAGRRPVLELLRAGRGAERILIAQGLDPSHVLGDIRRLASAASVPVRTVPRGEVDRIAGGVNHQGIVAVTGRYRYVPLDRLLGVTSPRLVFLDGITDPHNLGSILRSADGAGFSGVVLPARRSVGVTAAVRRVSAGAAEVVSVARVNSIRGALAEARTRGVWIVGLSEKAGEDIWSSPLLEPPVGLVLGAEDRGLSRAVADACDALVKVPTAGKISSLNVAVAGAVAMFEVARRMGEQRRT